MRGLLLILALSVATGCQWIAGIDTKTRGAGGSGGGGEATTTGTGGEGACHGITKPCAPYACSPTGCKTSCTGDAECDADDFCWQGACVKLTRVAAGGVFMPAGNGHTCALTTAGSVQCWGYNASGQLGDGSTTNSKVPVAVVGLSSGVTTIAAHGANTCALTTAGDVRCWGANGYGQLGDGSTMDSSEPVVVSGLPSPVTAIAVGLQHACAVANGGVRCWGYNASGQLGDGSSAASPAPVGVSGLSAGVVAIAAGDFHNCALTTAGDVQCWGYGGYGQLGNNSAISVNTPIAVQGLPSGIASITAGNEHTCALTTAGGVRCWGYDAQGELGNNATAGVVGLPVGVVGLSSGVAAIAAGGLHTCALTTGGGVQCWGSNAFGQLGDNATTEMVGPVAVSGLSSGAAAIAAGEYHTCALTIAGSVQCWGANVDGQLGNGSSSSSHVPVGVTEP